MAGRKRRQMSQMKELVRSDGALFIARGGGKPRKWCSVACRNRTTTHAHYHAMIKPGNERGQRERLARQHARVAAFQASRKPSGPEGD